MPNPLKQAGLLLAMLALGLLPAASAHAATILPPNFVPGDDAIGPAAGDQQAPAIALGGNTFLAVWADKRSMPTGAAAFMEFETSSDIYGMRLDASGNPLDALPFPVAAGRASQENPQVVWNGTNWLVVYESYTIHGTGYYYDKSLEAVRVSPTGQILDPTPILLHNLVPTLGMWSVATDGSNWTIAFQGIAASTDLLALRISPAGVVLDPPTHDFVKGTYYLRFNLRLAYAAGVYLLTWSDFSDTLGIRFDQNLNPLDSAPISLVSGSTLESVASNGSQFYMIWVAAPPPSYQTTVFGSRVSTAGVKLDGNGVNISQANTPDPYTAMSVVWDGSTWRVSWGHQGVQVARVSPAGQVLDPGGANVAGLSTGATAASPAGGLQIAWAEFDNSLVNSYDIFSAGITAGNAALPKETLSVGAPSQVGSDVAVGPGGYMVVYRSEVSGETRVMAQPLDSNGVPLTAVPLLLDMGNGTSGPGTPAVEWDGTRYLVAWANASGIVAQRLNQDGTVVDGAPFFVMTGFGPADVAAQGGVFLVTGLQYGFNIEIVFPVARRVRGSDGAVLDSSSLLLGNSFARYAAVTVVGGRWLIVWQRNFSHDDPHANTMGAFVASDGSKTPEFFVYGTYSTGSYTHGPAIASDGNVALMIQNAPASGTVVDLVGRLVNANGSLQPAFTLTPWIGNQYRPRVAWDGSQFVVVFQDQRNRFADWELDQLDARSDLFGLRVLNTGVILDPHGFLFSSSPDAEAYPNVAAANGVSLITGSILRHQPEASYRIGYAQYGVGGNAWPVSSAAGTPGGGDVPLPVSFSSGGSNDPDGGALSYAWDFGDGGSSSAPSIVHTYDVGGPYVATLSVTDDEGADTSDTVLIKPTNPNIPPVASAGAFPISGPAPLSVTFSAAGSYDPDGSLGNFYWTFSDGGDYWGATAYHTFTTNGTHTATLTVYDNRQGTGTATVTVTVGAPNQPPVAVATANPMSGPAPLTVSFSSAGSYDPDGVITSYSWNFGDGSSSTAANPSHTYGTPGSYGVTLTVTDDRGATDSAALTIVVQSGSGCSSNCLRSQAISLQARVGTNVTVTGKVTVQNELGNVVANARVSVTWTLPGGSTTSQIAKTSSSGIATFQVVGGTGTYTLTVTNITKTGFTFDPANSVLSKSITR